MKFTLSKPYAFEGKEYTELDLDLDALTGRDVALSKREWSRSGGYTPLVTFDLEFCAYLGAKAAGLPFEFVEKLPAKDYCLLSQTVSNFLMQ